jgi:hypothetical protein
LVVWYSTALAHPDKPGAQFALVFPLLHVAVGVGITYWTLATLVNATTIVARNGMLSVRHGPIPWWANCDVAIKDIEQLYCERQFVRGKRGSGRTYSVNALLTNGQKKIVLKSLTEGDEARFIEQEIEARVGIADARVVGEYEGD